ncbi:MAG: nucleotidyltransferase domain-containing protein [Candidatus Baldrarchaeota archaeon]
MLKGRLKLQVRSSNTVKIRLRRSNLSKVVEELKFSCKKIGRNLISAIIFGSLAKGNYSGSSDADVLLVLKDAPMDEGENIGNIM